MIKKHAQVGQKMRVDEINPARMKGGRASIGSWHGGVEGEWGGKLQKKAHLYLHTLTFGAFFFPTKNTEAFGNGDRIRFRARSRAAGVFSPVYF